VDNNIKREKAWRGDNNEVEGVESIHVRSGWGKEGVGGTYYLTMRRHIAYKQTV